MTTMKPLALASVRGEPLASQSQKLKLSSSDNSNELKKLGKRQLHEVSKRWYVNTITQYLSVDGIGGKQTAASKAYEASIIGSRAP
jgi:hypothetical protein